MLLISLIYFTTLSFFLVGNSDNKFSIDSTTGKIYAQSLDREQQERYTLTVQASDNGVPANTNQTRVIITVSGLHRFTIGDYYYV